MTPKYVFPILALAASSAIAAPRTLQQAQDIAMQTLQQRLGIATAAPQLQASARRAAVRSAEADVQPFTPYYLFTDAQQQAFVLVSGSDLMPEVLGYGTNAKMPADEADMPLSMRGWLQHVAEVEQYVEEHPDRAYLLESARATTQEVSKLLTTEWGQDAPYCDQCPQKNGKQTITGCMATSISQIINYFEYPRTFEGSYTYNDGGVNRSLDFSQVSIDYSLLRDRYTRNAGTVEERAEVAKLMYSVGVALSMHYDISAAGGSGAVTEMAIRGLVENLGHHKAQYLMRKHFTLDEWNSVIQNELINGRPMVMDGHSSEGGHSFVLDGVDARGFYHINWGWEGLADGYFDVSVMHPDQYGAGASESADGFTSYQDIIINLGNPDNTGSWHSPIVTYDNTFIKSNKTSLTLGQSFILTSTLHNLAPTDFSGYIGVLVTKDGEEYAREESTTLVNIDATRLKSNSNGTFTYTSYGRRDVSRTYLLPANMEEGEYKIYLYAREADSDVIDIVRQQQVRPNYWTCTVSGGRASLTCSQLPISLSDQSWSLDDGKTATRPTDVTVNLLNTSTSSVACVLYASFIRPDKTVMEDIQAQRITTLAAGEEGEAEFSVYFDQVGTWKVEIYGQPIGLDMTSLIKVCEHEFEVNLDATYGARFSVSKRLEAVTNPLYNVGPAEFTLGLNNEGAEYHGQMAVRLYSNKTNTADKYLQAEIICDVDFPAQTTQAVTISGNLNINKLTVDKASLYARAFYLRGDQMEQLTATASTVTIVRKEEASIEAVTVDEPDPLDFSKAEVYDICGRRISVTGALPRGIYIVNGQKKIVR